DRSAVRRCRRHGVPAAPFRVRRRGGNRIGSRRRAYCPGSDLSLARASGTKIAGTAQTRNCQPIFVPMPELPEVETVRRGLALKMTGRRIIRAELRRLDLRRPFPPMLAERLRGAQIGALGRRGKYILIEIDEDG